MNNQNNKRFYSVTTRATNINGLNSHSTKINYYNSKPKSVEAIRNNNKLLSSFVKGSGFGFNYYLNDNTEKDTQDTNKINNSNSNHSNHTLNSNTQINNQNNVLLIKDDSFGKENNKEEEINSEIDKLLNYYMTQLNDSNFKFI